MSLPAPLDRLADAPVFVFGCARSGTTWVLDIFDAHPQVATVNESYVFTEAIGVARLLSRQHWAPNRAGGPEGLAQLLPKEDFIEELRIFLARVLGRAMGEEHRFLVEKSPNHVWVAPVIAEIFPEARFVHVLRDGRDVVVSLLAAAESWAPNWKERSAGSVRQAASVWRRAVEKAAAVAPILGDRLLEVRYEDVHHDPIASYRRLFDFAGVPYDDAVLDGVQRATDFATNYEPGEERFRRGGRVGDWAARFSAADALNFQLAAGQTLVERGYEADDLWIHRLAEVHSVKPPGHT